MLEERRLLAADPIISEFQAANQSAVLDADGEASDWIEIENPDTQPIDLTGWHLTDDRTALSKWTFPAVTLAPRQHLLVFASNKDRRDPQSELHTNFRLTSDGEYLALVKPDGATVTQQFDPYPVQYENQSYGLSVVRDATPLIENEHAVRAFVPTDDSLGLNWTLPSFDDHAWATGGLSAGYEQASPGFQIVNTFDEPLDSAWTVDVPAGSGSKVTQENGAIVLTVPRSQGFTYADRGVAPAVLHAVPGENAADWEMIAHITQPDTDRGIAGIGLFDLDARAPRIQVEYQARSVFRLVVDDEIIASVTSASLSDYQIRLTRESTTTSYNAYFRLANTDPWALIGSVVEGPVAPILDHPSLMIYGRSAQLPITARFEDVTFVVPPQHPVYQPQLHLDLASAMAGRNASAYLRIPFEVSGDPARFDELRLLAQFDDGFRAYLNGVEVTAQNVPIEATWNSAASGSFGAVNGRLPLREIDLSPFLSSLKSGTNILAVHGMNVAADDSDFYFDANLIASDFTGQSPRYFLHPTPGARNEIAAATPPAVVGLQGLFFGERKVELRLEADNPNEEIHYTLDGSAPTIYSPRYTTPLLLSTTTMLEARTFDTSFGSILEPSPVVAATFIAADEALRNRTSDVPILIIDTLGQALPNTSATTLASANVVAYDINPDTGRTSLGDPHVDYLGRGGVRDRGSSTGGQTKPNMAFETWGANGTNQDDDEDVGLLGMPADSDWVLHAPFTFDRAMIRNQLAYGLTRSIGHWAPGTRAVEVYFNRRDGVVSEADYGGVYVLVEKIKLGDNRLDITPITPQDNTAPNITGGYIWKIDREDPGEPGFTAGTATLNWVEPKSPRSKTAALEDRATTEQQDYVVSYFTSFSNAAKKPNINDPEGYSKYIDVDSWIDNHLIYVLGDNVDALNLSTYLFKDRGKKVEFGPQWDYDRSMESDDDRDNNPNLWGGSGGTAFFTSNYWLNLFRDPGFWQRYVDRWTELRRGPLSDATLDAMIDRYAGEVQESQARNYDKWASARPRRSSPYVSGKLDGTWRGEVEHLRTWLHARAAFMDHNFVPSPTLLVDGQVAALGGVNVSSGQRIEIAGPQLEVINDVELISSTPGAATGRFFAPSDDSLGNQWTAANFDDSSWISGPLGAGFDDGTNFADYIKTAVRTPEGGTTLLMRTEFTLDQVDESADLILRMRYDDGFVAYLNGVEIARLNLRDDTLAWNSRANPHANPDGKKFEDLDVSAFRQLLVQGRNVLSVRVINATTSSNDVFAQPSLVLRQRQFVLSNAGQLYYTTDGSDPRGPDGKPSAHAIAAVRGQALTFTSNTRLFLRNFDDVTNLGSESATVKTKWSAPAQFTLLVNPLPDASVAVSEINYHPFAPTAAEAAAGWQADDFEFVEIHNRTATTLDLTGLRLEKGVTFDFAAAADTRFAPHGFAVIAANADAFRARYGANAPLLGVYSGTLDNAGETVSLGDDLGRTFDLIDYQDNARWGIAADGAGASLERLQPDVTPSSAASKWYAWQTSRTMGGTPGVAPDTTPSVRINEIVSRPAANHQDAIELYNASAQRIDISGWYLSDTPASLRKYRIPAGTTLGAGEYLVVDDRQFNAASPQAGDVPFGLDGTSGDEVWLTVPNQTDGVAAIVDAVRFGGSRVDESWGADDRGLWRPQSVTTLGAANAAPRAAGLVISEVQYHPVVSPVAATINADLGESDLEFIEIFNPSSVAVDLSRSELRGGISYVFPESLQLGSHERLLVLRFDPSQHANADRLAAFVAQYHIDPNLRVVGGFQGTLSNSDDVVTLWRAESLSPPNWVWEDEILYDDIAPWPVAADGGGSSLNRRQPTSDGHGDGSWEGRVPTPGNSPVVQSADFTGDGQVNAKDVDQLFAQLRAGGNDARFDLNADGRVDLGDRDGMILVALSTTFGDADLNGRFDSDDLVQILQAGQYEDDVADNSGWATGDFDGDGDFTTLDFVIAFQRGYYETAVPPAARAADRVLRSRDVTQPWHAESLSRDAASAVDPFAAKRSRGAWID